MDHQQFGVYLSVARHDYHNNMDHVRMGQSFMNTLGDLHPEIYEEVAATYNDPFYEDEFVPKFLEWLWNNKVEAGSV